MEDERRIYAVPNQSPTHQTRPNILHLHHTADAIRCSLAEWNHSSMVGGALWIRDGVQFFLRSRLEALHISVHYVDRPSKPSLIILELGNMCIFKDKTLGRFPDDFRIFLTDFCGVPGNVLRVYFSYIIIRWCMSRLAHVLILSETGVQYLDRAV